MGSTRRAESNPVTFFTFQDLITCVLAIMIMLVLLFALRMAQSQSSAKGTVEARQFEDRAKEIAGLRTYLAALKSGQLQTIEHSRVETALQACAPQLLRLKDEMNDIDRQIASNNRLLPELSNTMTRIAADVEQGKLGKRVRFIPGKTGVKLPVIVECGGEQIVCGPLDENGKPQTFPVQARGRFMEYVPKCDQNKRYFVLMITPASVPYATDLIDQLEKAGFEVGWDALEDGVSIDFGEK